MERESVAEQDKTRNNKMFVLPVERDRKIRESSRQLLLVCRLLLLLWELAAEVAFLSGRGGRTLTVAKNFSINIDNINSINSINNINNNLSSSSKTKWW